MSAIENSLMDSKEASKDIITQFEIKDSEPRPWNFQQRDASAGVVSERICAKLKMSKLMDLAANDTTEF